jgi:hypothetical protein
MICLWKSARLLFACCLLSLGCSGRENPNDATETLPLALQARAAPVGAIAAMTPEFIIVAPPTVPLGSPFTAAIVRANPGPVVTADQYDWGGEGLSVTDVNAQFARLTCTWSGFHALEVTPKAQPSRARFTAQIYCSPPLCADYPQGSCPGVKIEQEQLPPQCPKTSILVRVASPGPDPEADCPREVRPLPDQDTQPNGGWWEGGFLLDAKDEAGGRFCSYRWYGLPNQEPIPPPPDPEKWQWDCPRIAAQATANELNESLANLGREELGTIQWNSGATVPVRIAVVDTAAQTWGDPDNNPHGKAVGALTLSAACDNLANCKVQAFNYLGLPLYRDTRPSDSAAVVRRDTTHGGSFGAHADLVRAVLDAVAPAPLVRTVLNLSVAYEAPELAQEIRPLRTDFANRVVLSALHNARCRGALIVAAAGNGPVPADLNQTPGFPARWTELPALTRTECLNRYNIARFRDDSPAPLLYAVHGLTFGAESLLTTRGKGKSTIAALGFEAVRQLPNGSYTRRLTGTSMATATVSGIFASLWSHAGGALPDTLMGTLTANGASTGVPADFGPFPASLRPTGPGEVRRVTRCSITAAFPNLGRCTIPDPDAVLPTDTVPPLPSRSSNQRALAPEDSTQGLRPEDVPWLFPQPSGEPGCGACGLSGRRLSLIFRPSFPLSSVSNMRLVARAKTSLGLANFAGVANDTSNTQSDDLLTAQIPIQADPISLTLDESFETATAAELTYKIKLDAIVTIDTSESVIITAPEPPPDPPPSDPL